MQLGESHTRLENECSAYSAALQTHTFTMICENCPGPQLFSTADPSVTNSQQRWLVSPQKYTGDFWREFGCNTVTGTVWALPGASNIWQVHSQLLVQAHHFQQLLVIVESPYSTLAGKSIFASVTTAALSLA